MTSGVRKDDVILTRMIIWQIVILCSTLPRCSGLDDLLQRQEDQRKLSGAAPVHQLPSHVSVSVDYQADTELAMDDDVIHQAAAEEEAAASSRLETKSTTPLKPLLIVSEAEATTPLKPLLIVSEDLSKPLSPIGTFMERQMGSVSVPLTAEDAQLITFTPAGVRQVYGITTITVLGKIGHLISSNRRETRPHLLYPSTGVSSDINDMSLSSAYDLKNGDNGQSFPLTPSSPTLFSDNPSYKTTAVINSDILPSISIRISNTAESSTDCSSPNEFAQISIAGITQLEMLTTIQVNAITTAMTETAHKSHSVQTGVSFTQDILYSSASKSTIPIDNVSLAIAKTTSSSSTTATTHLPSLPRNISMFSHTNHSVQAGVSYNQDISSTTSKSMILEDSISLLTINDTEYNNSKITVSSQSLLSNVFIFNHTTRPEFSGVSSPQDISSSPPTTQFAQTKFSSTQDISSSSSKAVISKDNKSLIPIKATDYSTTTMTTISQSSHSNVSAFLLKTKSEHARVLSAQEISPNTSKPIIQYAYVASTSIKTTSHSNTTMTDLSQFWLNGVSTYAHTIQSVQAGISHNPEIFSTPNGISTYPHTTQSVQARISHTPEIFSTPNGISTYPHPRQSVQVGISHTPEVFSTPSFSSTLSKANDLSSTTVTVPQHYLRSYISSCPHTTQSVQAGILFAHNISSTTSKSMVLKSNISSTLVPSDTLLRNVSYIQESIKSSCKTNLGSALYQAAWEAGTELPKECWDILCSEESPNTFVNEVDDFEVLWFQKNNPICYDHLPSGIDGDLQFNRMLSIAPGIRFMLLKPSCIQTRGFSYIENLRTYTQYLPNSCRRNLCNSGAALSYYENYPIVLIEPEAPSSARISDACVNEMKHAYKNRNNLLKRGSINVYSLNDYPVYSPCPTIIIFIIKESGVHVIIPFRAAWCPSLIEDNWRYFLISFYSVFQSNRTSEFYQCLVYKSGNQTYINGRYKMFFQNLLNENMTAPEMPKSCVEFFCHEQIEISHVNQAGSEFNNFWFSYVKDCSKVSCKSLEIKASHCQQKISGADHPNNKPIAKIILPQYIPQSDEPRAKYLFLSMLWSCPSGNGDGIAGRLRADALANLWLMDNTLPEICGKLICKSDFYQFVPNVIIAYIVDPNLADNSLSCRQRANEINVNVLEKMKTFSFKIKATNNTIVFIMSTQEYSWKTISLLGILQSTSNMELLSYCDRNPLQISFDMFSGVKQYTCYQRNNSSLELPQSLQRRLIWSVKQIATDTQIVFLKNLQIPYSLESFIMWLVSTNANFSSVSEDFILSISSTMLHVFMYNYVYVLDSKTFHHDGFQTFMSELQVSHFKCNTSRFFTVCFKPGSLFPNAVDITAYLVIIHECSIDIYDQDKIISLLLTHFHNIQMASDYLCKMENIIVMIPSKGRRVHYNVKGPEAELEEMLSKLKATTLGWVWTKDAIKINPDQADSNWCIHIREPVLLLKLLSFNLCLYYSRNNSTITFQVPNESYYLVYFPLSSQKEGKSTLPLLDWRNQSKIRHTLSINESNIHGSGKILISELERNPAYTAIMEEYSFNREGVIATVKTFTKIFVSATLSNNTYCIDDLKSSRFIVYETKILFLIGPIQKDLLDSSCFLSLPMETMERLQFLWDRNMTTINKFWPTCLYNIIFAKLDVLPLVIDWDYLSDSCKVQEIMLLSFSVIITLITIIGNSLVLVVIFTTDLKRDATFLIRASLAVADLLMGLLPACLAVYDHVSLMTGRLGLRHLDPDSIHASFTQLSSSQSPGFQQVRFERYGYPMVASMMLNISANVSLFSLALMSIERYRVVTGSSLCRRHVLIGISSSWCLSIALSLLVNSRQNGWSFAGYFDPITKLTVSIGTSVPSVSLVVFYTQVIVLGAAAVTVIVMTIVTLIIFSYKDYQSKKMLTIHSAIRDQGTRRTTKIFLSMVALFSMATIPLVVDVMADLSTNSPVGHFFAWWLFMAGASWNWILYSFVGSKFYAKARKLICRRQ